MGKCLDDLRANYSRGLSDAEIEEIFKDAQRLWKGVQASRQASNQNALAQQLAKQQAEREQIAAVIKKRNTYLQLERKVAILESTLGNWQGREGEGLSAMLVGGQKLRQGSRMSVDALRTGIKGQYVGGFLNDLDELGATHYAIFKKGAMDREIAEAMWTIDNPNAPAFSGPKEAMDIAQVAHKWQEKARLDQNRVGGFIGKEPGYIVRQSHDQARIARAGFEKWRADIEDKLDWTRTGNGRFDPQQNPDFMPDDKAAFLSEVYDNLKTGVHLKETGAARNPLASSSGVGSVASKVSAERVLHFTDGGAWFDYNAKYGKGNLREAMLGGFSRAADNTALMQVFGPSPQANLENSIKFIRESLRKRGDDAGIKRLDKMQTRLANELSELDGSVNIPAHQTAASVGRIVRAIESMAKLGGAVISGMSDAPNFAYEMAYQGKGFASSLVRGLSLMVKGRGTLEQRRILSSCGVFYDSMCGDIIARFSGSDTPGKMSAMMNLFFRMNGLSWWTDSWKKAATLMMSHDMAHIRGKNFGQLSTQERRLFELYGIDAGQWDMLRKGRTMAADGRDYLTPEAAFDATDAEIEAYLASKGTQITRMRVENFRHELADRLRTLYRDRVQYAVLEPDARTNAILRQGLRPGTMGGELLRYFTQFKSFPTVFMQRSMGRELYGRGADTLGTALKGAGKGALASAFLQNRHGEMSNFAGLFVMTTIFGYGAMTAKQLLAGKTPRELLDENSPLGLNWKTILAAAVQGGGLGIYGDFLFGEKSRMGGSLAGSFGGPAYSSAESLYGLYLDARDGRDLGANSFRFFFNHIPGNNLFYIRAALDYTILNSFYEYLNPGYLRRMRRRVEKENGQTFYRGLTMEW